MLGCKQNNELSKRRQTIQIETLQEIQDNNDRDKISQHVQVENGLENG